MPPCKQKGNLGRKKKMWYKPKAWLGREAKCPCAWDLWGLLRGLKNDLGLCVWEKWRLARKSLPLRVHEYQEDGRKSIRMIFWISFWVWSGAWFLKIHWYIPCNGFVWAAVCKILVPWNRQKRKIDKDLIGKSNLLPM